MINLFIGTVKTKGVWNCFVDLNLQGRENAYLRYRLPLCWQQPLATSMLLPLKMTFVCMLRLFLRLLWFILGIHS